jgi:hypothetical protein
MTPSTQNETKVTGFVQLTASLQHCYNSAASLTIGGSRNMAVVLKHCGCFETRRHLPMCRSFFQSNARECVYSQSIVYEDIFQSALAERNLLVEYLVPECINVKWCSTLTVSAVMTEAVHLDLRTDQIEARLLDTQSHGLNRCLGNTDFFNALTTSAD